MPRGRALREPLAVLVDTRERYPYRFSALPVDRHREALPAGDYGVRGATGELLATVERKTLENLATSLSDGSLAFQMGRLAEVPLAAVAVEGRYAALLTHAHAPAGWLADQLVRLQTRYPQVPVVFLDSRRHAEDWTHRFLATALTDRQAILERCTPTQLLRFVAVTERIIPQRELRNHIGEILRQAEAGTEFTVTVRGRPVARLGPPDRDGQRATDVSAERLQRMLAETAARARMGYGLSSAAIVARISAASRTNCETLEPWRLAASWISSIPRG